MAAPRVPRDAAPATVAKKAAARAAARKAATPDSPKSPTAEGEGAGAGAGAGGADGSPTVGDGEAIGGPASKRVLRSQGRRTMRKLLDAAMIAFDQRGYYDTRVNDVVEIAETSHGTFYLYFSNKEDLLRALVAEATGEAQTLYDALSTLPAEGGAPRRVSNPKAGAFDGAASFSPDGLTGLEANLRFAGPETMESKIFARLTAWQNWIFQRPNAIGEEGALKRYGTGQKPVFDTRRV